MDARAYIQTLKKQRYSVFGSYEHSAAKLCTWLKKSLKDQGVCYKQLFYGINSNRCLQMTPNIYCNQRCIFCWRSWESSPINYLPPKWNEPAEIVEQSIIAQRKLISGFGGIPEQINKQKFKEAHDPNQVAISLTGEPTLYPYLDELVKEYEKRDFTTFVVSNGMKPEVIEKIKPTQLYISLDAPDEVTHKKVNSPQFKGSWEKLNQTFEILAHKKKQRRVIRITAIKGLNMFDPIGYARLVEKSGTDFVEVKSYMFIGGSRQRLTLDNMPRHHETKEFAEQIAQETGYEIIGEQPASRVVLLSSGEKNPTIKVK